jgi:hypothetical protein
VGLAHRIVSTQQKEALCWGFGDNSQARISFWVQEFGSRSSGLARTRNSCASRIRINPSQLSGGLLDWKAAFEVVTMPPSRVDLIAHNDDYSEALWMLAITWHLRLIFT